MSIGKLGRVVGRVSGNWAEWWGKYRETGQSDICKVAMNKTPSLALRRLQVARRMSQEKAVEREKSPSPDTPTVNPDLSDSLSK